MQLTVAGRATLVLLGAAARCLWLTPIPLIALAPPSLAQTPIQFAGGSDSGAWTGFIERGAKTFSLQMSKGQRLWILGNDVYTWSAVSPSGRELGCQGNTYCSPGDQLGISLPESGEYLIRTVFRMDGGVNTRPVARRYVRVTFTVR